MPSYDTTVMMVNSQADTWRGAGVDVGESIHWQDGLRVPRRWFHPTWLRRASDWRLFRICYVGGREFLDSTSPVTLHSHARESKESYCDRRKRAFYRNHCETVVGTKADAIYQPQVLRGQLADDAAEEEVEPAGGVVVVEDPAEESAPPRITRRQEADPTFEDFLHDIDGKGTNADPFWDEVTRWAMVAGVRWVEIGMTAAPELAARAASEGRQVTALEARAGGIGTFFASTPAEAVIDWSEDERGRLKYAVVLSKDVTRTPLAGQRDEQPKARLIARVLLPDREDRYAIGEKGGRVLIGSFLHKFGEVPLVKVWVRSEEQSEIEDIAPMNVAVYNYDALVDEQIYRQTFNQLVGKVKDPTKFMSNVTGTDALLAIGVEEDLSYLAPQTETIKTIQARAEEVIDEIYAIANLRTRPGGKGSQPAVDVSGIAYAFEGKNAETDLANTATRLEEVEHRLLAMRARALGLDPAGVVVQYPREFDVRALQARAAEARALTDAGVPALAKAEVLKNLVRKALPRLPASKLKAIDEQIDADARKPKEPLPGVGEKGGPGGPGAKPGSNNGAPPPPNQALLAPGNGASEERVARRYKVDEKVRVK